MTGIVREADLQDYLDGRLDEERRAEIAAYLLQHPDKAAQLPPLREEAEALRSLGRDILGEPVPERLRAALRGDVHHGRRRLARRLQVQAPQRQKLAAALVIFIVGAVAGWGVHGYLPRPPDPFLTQAEFAFSFFDTQREYPVEFGPDRDDDFKRWIAKLFKQAVGMPDLGANGFKYIGGRILPTNQSQTGIYMFEGSDGARVAIFFWPADQASSRDLAVRQLDKLTAALWQAGGFGFALVGDKSIADFQPLSQSIFAYYKKAFSASP
jgi:anti-sigma factor RsiW